MIRRPEVAPDFQPAPSIPSDNQMKSLPLIELRGEITPWTLASAIGEKSLVIVKMLKDIGIVAKSNTALETDVAEFVCKQKGYQLKRL